MVELFTCLETRQKLGKWICSEKCFMKGALPSQEDRDGQGELNEFTIAKIKLGLQVFKFEPCNVRLYCTEDEVTCYQVIGNYEKHLTYFYLKIYKYFKQEYNERKTFPEYYANLKESAPIQKSNKRGKNGKVKKYNFHNMKNLEENFKRTFAIDYKPCYHSHYDKTCTEEEQSCMSEDCRCFQRGFCDKYCGCDLSKCKIR